jgi:hypothetical protein
VPAATEDLDCDGGGGASEVCAVVVEVVSVDSWGVDVVRARECVEELTVRGMARVAVRRLRLILDASGECAEKG